MENITKQVHIVLPSDANGAGRLFGGRLMEWIDIVSAVASRRYCGSDVTTVAVENLHFKAPAFVNDTIVLSGSVVSSHITSMKVKVQTYVEKLDGEREHINTAYLIMVAIDDNGIPKKIKTLI